MLQTVPRRLSSLSGSPVHKFWRYCSRMDSAQDLVQHMQYCRPLGSNGATRLGRLHAYVLSSRYELQRQPSGGGGSGGGSGSIEPTNHIAGSCSRSSFQCNTALACVTSVSARASGVKGPPNFVTNVPEAQQGAFRPITNMILAPDGRVPR